MSPDQFLSLAQPLGEQMEFEEFSDKMLFLEDLIRKGEPMEIPFLQIMDWQKKDGKPGQDCRIDSHEGRHRMHTAKKLGIKKVPVVLYFEELNPKTAYHVSDYMRMDEQKCIACDEDHCSGFVDAERDFKMTDGEFVKIPGKSSGISVERIPVDWNEIPDVKNATQHWREAEGIEL